MSISIHATRRDNHELHSETRDTTLEDDLTRIIETMPSRLVPPRQFH